MLAASDFLGIVQSRIATLDIFIAVWSVLCIYLALRYVQSGHRLRWLVLCGVAGGLALGTKWSGGFACVAALAIILLYRRRSWQEPPGALVWHALRDAVAPALALVVLPVALYVASYADYFTKGHHTLSQWWALQHEMWWFNENLHATHTYASKSYTWIFDYRPVWYYYEQVHGAVHGIISIGNPLLWWASVPALVALVVLAIVRRERELALLPLIVALLYLPWFSASRTSFMYYMTPVAPFMALAVATALRELSRRACRAGSGRRAATPPPPRSPPCCGTRSARRPPGCSGATRRWSRRRSPGPCSSWRSPSCCSPWCCSSCGPAPAACGPTSPGSTPERSPASAWPFCRSSST